MPPPFADHELSPEITPKVEPEESRFPTPISRASMQARPRRRQRDSDDDIDGYVSIPGAPINLGNSLFSNLPKRPRLMIDLDARPSNNRPEERRRDRPSSPQRHADVEPEQAQPSDPFGKNPAYGKGPTLRDDQLDADQKRVVREAVWNRKNVCSIGAAGTGKSETCECIVVELRGANKHVSVVAPSGTAAVNVHAQTLHSFFGLRKDQNRGIDELRTDMKPTTKHRLKKTDVLIIDEISMVSYEMFDRMNELAKFARGSDLPFGGIQLIVFGDFCQLPPVRPHQFCYECGIERKGVPALDLAPASSGRSRRGRRETDGYKKYEVWRCDEHGDIKDSNKMWAFKSSQWDEMNFLYLPLNQVHRQIDQDFLSMLTKVRHGSVFTPDEITLLRDHECDVTNAVQLEGTKAGAWKENSRCLNRLTGQEHRYRHEDDFVWQRELHPELADIHRSPTHSLNAHAYEEWVNLKKGMPVILQKNISVEKGLVNGSQGVIDHFIPYDESQQPPDTSMEGGRQSQLRRGYVRDYMSAQRRRDNSTSIPVVKFNNLSEPVAIWPDCSVSERGFQRPHSLLIRTQIPLLAGWALTIHKAQGMTLQKAVVNLDHCWQSGMAYVALSRVKTLHGLKVEGLKASTISSAVDEEVKAFLEDKFGVSFD